MNPTNEAAATENEQRGPENTESLAKPGDSKDMGLGSLTLADVKQTTRSVSDATQRCWNYSVWKLDACLCRAFGGAANQRAGAYIIAGPKNRAGWVLVVPERGQERE